jgi:ligand-binding sensor domain-containing protein
VDIKHEFSGAFATAPDALLLLALACLLGGTAFAAPTPTLRFEHLSVDDGLAQESVLAIAQDRDGFMWFGTQSGLSRYDGYRFTNFRNVVGDPTSLVNNWVRVLYVDRKGRLWIGTDGGLALYNPESGSFSSYLPDEPAKRGNGNRHIRAIVDDGKEGLWLATSDGLQHFDIATKRFATWHHVPGVADSLASDRLTSLALAPDGRLWVGTSNGARQPGAGPDALQPPSVAAGRQVRRGPGPAARRQPAAVDRQHGRPGAPRARPEPGARTRGRAGKTFPLRRGGRHAGRRDQHAVPGCRAPGLGRHPRPRPVPLAAGGRRFEHHPHRITDHYSLGDNQVSALFGDRVGTFWVGTWYGGVSRADLGGGGFARIVRGPDLPATLNDNKVRGIACRRRRQAVAGQ